MEPRLIKATRALTRKNQRLAAAYLASHETPRLHVGCGDNELPGWLNTELCPRGGQIFLDATRPFPLPDSTFASVYSEHMIEHIAAGQAETMLSECFRVMTPGAVIRIVTPDLAFLLRLLESPPAPDVAAYIRYSLDAHRLQAPAADGVYVFNNFVRAWGHQFIHTEATLRALMARAGFEEIRTCRLAESADPAMAGLAKADRMPAGFLDMESLVLEGRRPARRG